MTTYRITSSGVLVPVAPALLKRNYIEGEAGAAVGLEGRYRLVVRRADGSVKKDTGWFKNLILDAGLNRLGSGAGGGTCVIGTGTATPVASQTALASLSASTTTVQSNTSGNSGATAYYTWLRITYRFSIGSLNGNYSEVGIGWGTATLFSRALIVDVGGNPTPITVLSDEQLDVTYELRCYTPLTDWGGSYTISGTSYTVVGRRAFAGASPGSSAHGPLYFAMSPLTIAAGNYTIMYNGAIGAVTASPSGTGANVNNAFYASLAAYSNNSYARSATLGVPLTDGNVAGGITGMLLTAADSTGFQFQYGFTPALPKDNTKTLQLTFSIAWARRP